MNGSIVPRFSLFSFIYMKIYIYTVYIDFYIYETEQRKSVHNRTIHIVSKLSQQHFDLRSSH